MSKSRKTFSITQKLEYAKLIVEDGYSNTEVEHISGASKSAVSRWKKQYEKELLGYTPSLSALTPEHKRIQDLEKALKRSERDIEILKKAAAFFIQDNPKLR